ncbi:MAG: hypothetical protein HYZ53_25060 [Planctomycetes bacterium]|nr:hypothetical protein [Planctomycetota bacterium]
MAADLHDPVALFDELRSAGLAVVGCASTGRIDWAAPPTPAQLGTAQAVLAAHDPGRRAREESARLAEARDLVARFDALDEGERRRLLRLVSMRVFGIS